MISGLKIFVTAILDITLHPAAIQPDRVIDQTAVLAPDTLHCDKVKLFESSQTH